MGCGFCGYQSTGQELNNADTEGSILPVCLAGSLWISVQYYIQLQFKIYVMAALTNFCSLCISLYLYTLQVMWLGQTWHKRNPVAQHNEHTVGLSQCLIDLDVVQPGSLKCSECSLTKKAGWIRETDPTRCCHGLNTQQMNVFLWEYRQIVLHSSNSYGMSGQFSRPQSTALITAS